MKTIKERSRIKARFIILCALLLIVVGQTHAGSQFDITLNVPYHVGLKTVAGTFGTFSEYLFVVPDVKWHWYFGSEELHLGLGLRLWTLILESALYPQISLEAVAGDFVINAGIGGGAFLFFGLYNTFETLSLFLPELSIAYRLGEKKQFSLGTSVLFIIAPELASLDAFAFIGTAFARFTF